ncbi:MAG: leucine--tRNA ligase [Flavobacteriaceae bacterium]
MRYDFKAIEAKWQGYWAQAQTYKAEGPSDKPKYYVLDMFPYPSGAGLHVGHPLGYIASDIYARYKRLCGYNVLHPQGYDSFGLPAEQYAIETGQHPATTTEQNIQRYREQLDRLGFSFDWSCEVRTSDPDYFRWTQWIFLKLYDAWYDKTSDKARPVSELLEIFLKEGNSNLLASCDENTPVFSAQEWQAMDKDQQADILLKYRLTYLAETEVNWCPYLGTVLANDEIVNGLSERGGHPVVRKKMTQWIMRISAYAPRLLAGLDDIDWTFALKESQRNWIGKSVGALVHFEVKDSVHKVSVFTTRPDTIFGVSFVTLAPEHALVLELTTAEQRNAVLDYIQTTARRSERDRMADVKSISGVFTGSYVLHPFTKKPLPIWIGDYVLAGYGTGAVMAVPCGDQRDHDFAKFFELPIPNIFKGIDVEQEAFVEKAGFQIQNSDFLNDLDYASAMKVVIEHLESAEVGQGQTNFRLRDAVFSRQRYWGEPFPIYYVNGRPEPIDPKYLPIKLPQVDQYLPTEDGAPPLGRATQWAWDTAKKSVVDNSHIDHITVFPLELNTMPGWAGSAWYFFRYMDVQNDKEFASPAAMAYWKQVDLYIGGSEHATGHLLYSRFWTKFLYDLGIVPVDEPFKKLINQGMILGTSAFVHRVEGTATFLSKDQVKGEKTQLIHVDVNMVDASNQLNIEQFKNWRKDFSDATFVTNAQGQFVVKREVEKMSKSKYNVVNPDEICDQYGADSLRMYEMFLGPLEQAKPWNTAGISGVYNFLNKLWRLYIDDENNLKVTDAKASAASLKTLHKSIKKVKEDIEGFSFNTSVSTFMIAVNEFSAQSCNSKEVLEPLLILISPYAPHISEELWHRLGHNSSVTAQLFPKFDEGLLVEQTKVYPVSFNGKMRFTLELPLDLDATAIEQAVLKYDKTVAQLAGSVPKKVIIVPGKIINIVQ